MDYSVVTQLTVDIKINQENLVIDLHVNTNDNFNADDLLNGLEAAKDYTITGYSVEKVTNLDDRNMIKFNIIFGDNALSITQYPADLDVYVDGTRII